MSYDKRKEVMEQKKQVLEHIMSFFPKDYSDAVLNVIRQGLSGQLNALMKNYVDAFCEDKDLCPLCITGGWNCGSDHK